MESDSDSFDDDVGLLKPALGTGPLPDDFDPDKPPQNGEEYLHHVMYEAKKLKSWVSVEVDRSKFKNKKTFKLDMVDDNVTAPQKILPSAEWQNAQLKDFDKLRLELDSQRDPNPSKDICNVPVWLEKIKTQSPTFSEMNTLSQRAKTNLLFHIISLLEETENGDPLPRCVGLWLYAIFATLEIPLSPEICYYLRDIARNCRRLRSHLDPESDVEICKPYNLAVCLVGRYFKQLDLADPL